METITLFPNKRRRSLSRVPTSILVCVCSAACQVGPRGDTQLTPLARSAPLPTSLRSAVLQTLNQDGGPGFGFTGHPETAATAPFSAENQIHGFAAEFSSEGVRIAPRDPSVTPLVLRLERFGGGQTSIPAAMGGWERQGARIERRSRTADAPITEWYVNGALGLEQGFTIDAAPRGDGQLTVQLAIDEPWSVRAHTPGRSVELVERDSKTVLTYGELYAFDAAGRTLAASLVPTPGGVAIQVDAEAARYPVTIDPFVQQQTLNVSGLAANDEFGFSVAIDRDGLSAIVGVPGRDISLVGIGFEQRFEGSGTAYVFVRNGQSWQMQQQLSSGGVLSLSGIGGAETGRRFGHAVAIAGDTAVVSAPSEAGETGTADRGVTYVFRRIGTTWTRVQTLQIASVVSSRHFGVAVALDDENLAIASDPVNQLLGRAYVYVASSDPATPFVLRSILDMTGSLNVAVDADTVVVGDPSEGRVMVSRRQGNTFPTDLVLTSPDGGPLDRFGASVDIVGDVLLVGAPDHKTRRGAGYVFRRAGANWAFEQKLETTVVAGTYVGSSAAISGGTSGSVAVLGAPVSDAAAVIFRRGSNSWTYDQTLTAPGGSTSVGVGVDPQTARPLLVLGVPFGPGASATGMAIVHTDTPSTSPPSPSPPTPGGVTPPALSPSIVTGSTVQLNWSALSSAVSYRLRAGTAPGASNAFDGNVGAVTTMTAVSVPNGSYFVRVHAVGASGESGPSNEVRVDVGPTSNCTPPAAPTNLRATVSGGVVTLTWSAAAGAVSYIIEAGSAGGLSNLAALDVGAGTTFMASAPPGTYFVRVRTRNACGATAASSDIVVQVG